MSNVIDRLRLLKVYFNLVRDPNQTKTIFELIPISLRLATPQQVSEFENQFLEDVGFLSQWKEKFVPEQPTLEDLKTCPDGSFGRAVYDHLSKYGLDLDFYPPLSGPSLVDYISYRISQDHDFWHVLLNQSIEIEDELAVQAFGVAQFGSAVGAVLISGGLLHLIMKNPKRAVRAIEGISRTFETGKRARFLPGFPLRERLTQPIESVRRELRISVHDADFPVMSVAP